MCLRGLTAFGALYMLYVSFIVYLLRLSILRVSV